MKKIIIWLLLTVNAAGSLFGQELPRAKSFAAVTGGYSFLSGNPAHSVYSDNSSGYASSSGFGFGAEGAWFFSSYIGIGGAYANTSFATSGVQSLADGYKEDFDVDSTTVNVSGRYVLNSVLVGPYFSLPLNRLTFDLHVLAGISIAQTPQFTTYLEDQQNATFSQQSATATAFAFRVGAGLRYDLTGHLALKLNADYLNTRPDFAISNINRANNAGRLITSYHESFRFFTVGLGIAWQFGD